MKYIVLAMFFTTVISLCISFFLKNLKKDLRLAFIAVAILAYAGLLFFDEIISERVKAEEQQRILAMHDVQPKQAIYKTMPRERSEHPDMRGIYPEI